MAGGEGEEQVAALRSKTPLWEPISLEIELDAAAAESKTAPPSFSSLIRMGQHLTGVSMLEEPAAEHPAKLGAANAAKMTVRRISGAKVDCIKPMPLHTSFPRFFNMLR
jgi:hypothetical protein